MTLRPITLVLLATAAVASGQERMSNAMRQRLANFQRPGWVVVDGRFVQSQADLATTELFTFADTAGRYSLVTRPAPRVEPLLRNYRTALVKLNGSDFAWKLSCPGRVWNDTRASGTQQLLLTAVADREFADDQWRLTRVEITPYLQAAAAVVVLDEQPTSVIAVMARDFIELTVAPLNGRPSLLVRAPTARQLLNDRPTDVRKYLVPLLKLLNAGENPLAAAPGDVYRAFPDLPVDPGAGKAVAAVLPKLNASDPLVRQEASDKLHALGRRGVQAAMRLDLSGLAPETADRIATYVAESSRDARPAEVLRRDPNFLLDCLTDSDVNVRVAAGTFVGK
ncbi:MAG TPA: hypothetical protein VF595_15130 [Tepidisphaeraceae bacterium]|jgi:hypothetical protein